MIHPAARRPSELKKLSTRFSPTPSRYQSDRSQLYVYDSYVNDLRAALGQNDEEHFVAAQLLELHSTALQKTGPRILELGVNQGQSTKIFLNAISNQPQGELISVDLHDCSSAAHGDKWTFIQSDSADVKAVTVSAPQLLLGIDLMYVDSLHTRQHVEKELYGYFRYLNPGATIFFDDVSSLPYMRNQRKDNLGTERANREIRELIEATFLANLDKLDLTVFYGSTGLARIEKRGPLGEDLAPPRFIKPRTPYQLWRAWNKLFGPRR